MRLLAPALVLALILPGCISTPAPTTQHPASSTAAVCATGLCDLVATTTPETRQANELSIAVNPKDPLNIIATGKDYTPDEAGDCVWAGVYATKDGGKTWTDQNVPGSPWKHEKDPTTPTTDFTKFWCVTDPVVKFGPDGTAYWAVMPYQCDPISGSKTGRGEEKRGGANDWLWSCSSMFVLVSHDGGMTWPVSEAKQVSLGPFLANDKSWLAVAPDGTTLMLCWDYAGDYQTPPTPGEIPQLPVAPPTDAMNNAAIVCSVSKDKAVTWSKPAPATSKGGSPYLVYDASGTAWMTATTGDSILVLSSKDGASWTDPVNATGFAMPSSQNDLGWPVLNGSVFRLSQYGQIAVDKSAGPHKGRVYVVFFDYSAGNGDIKLVWSDDGKAWSKPITVNDDTQGHDQFLPALSVGPDGTVDVSWQDRRDDPANHVFQTYYAYSLDGGQTFSQNVKITSAPSDEQYSHHQNGAVFLGDYRDSDSSVRGKASFLWVDTRAQKADARVATVQRPSADGR